MSGQELVIRAALDAGADRAVAIKQEQIVYDRAFRDLCRQNRCGRYGRYYVCPPDAGDIDALIAQAKTYPQAVLYQSVYPLTDSFDIEGMQEAGRRNHLCAQRLQETLRRAETETFLHLSSGGCSLCPRCGKEDGVPCRHPDRALSNMETYGMHVSETARNAGLAYVNGANTVTYFGIVLLKER